MSVQRHVAALAPRSAVPVVKQAARLLGEATAAWRPLPDFLLLGTKRGGTTSLWRHLLTHPQVLPLLPALEHIKSPHYFYWHEARGERFYRSHFPLGAHRRLRERVTGRSVVAGEASPYYLFDPRVPDRVARLVPHARLVVLLRDPVRRAYSHYWERVDQGVEPLGFADALAAEDARTAGEVEAMLADPGYYSRAHDWYSYRTRGEYLPQLRRWYRHFPADQLLVLRSEDLYRDPAATVAQVWAFLGLDPHALEAGRHENKRQAPPLEPAVATALREHYLPHNRALESYLGRSFGWEAVPARTPEVDA